MRLILLFLAICLIFTGCSSESADQVEEQNEAETDSIVEVDENDTEDQNPVVGTWEVVEVLEGEDIGNTGVIYTFNDDGTMSSKSGVINVEGTYSIAGDTIKISQGEVNMDILYSFEDGNMIYKIIKGTQTFLLKKK
ncbi:MAG: hypothetical protein APR54_07695 [Candidatus Cloacimonas sp. SDB]|nr:MAG: hypothetical protein APR54_07695 [Candidatus Cloacimonas sp. SDB]